MLSSNEKIVYHYCSTSTFLNIIKNKSIRLSDINKSNDYLELKVLINMVLKEIERIVELNVPDLKNNLIVGMNDKKAVISLATLMCERMKKNNDFLCYAACFSEASDLLSQWCRYADDGCGIAIGFRENVITKICSKFSDMLKFEKVTYVKDDSIIENKLITDVAKNFIDNFFCYAESNNILDINGINSYWEKIDTSVLSQESMFIKSDKFSDEKEWRLVINDDLDKTRNEWDKQYNWKGEDNLTEFEKLIPNSLEYRYTKNNIISYMDLNFSDYIEDDLMSDSTLWEA